jgi:hypothetical protein
LVGWVVGWLVVGVQLLRCLFILNLISSIRCMRRIRTRRTKTRAIRSHGPSKWPTR